MKQHIAKAKAKAKIVVNRHVVAVIRYRHHYYTAAGISITLITVFHMIDLKDHLFHWLYALCETFVNGYEENKNA